MTIKIFTTGGTIDKIYFDAKDKYQIGESLLKPLLQEAQVSVDYDIHSIFKKDSLEITDEDRQQILHTIQAETCSKILVTHGTDTMVQTAQVLSQIKDKVIVLTGSLQPARFKDSDAPFNVGAAIAAVQVLEPGVYITMNGQVFEPNNVRKNLDKNRFERITS